VVDLTFLSFRILCHYLSSDTKNQFNWNSLSAVSTEVYLYEGITSSGSNAKVANTFNGSYIKLFRRFFSAACRNDLLVEVLQALASSVEVGDPSDTALRIHDFCLG